MSKVQLVSVEGYSRKVGFDAEGCEYFEQFNSEIEDSIQESGMWLEECPKCGENVREVESLEACPHCGCDMFEELRPVCEECGQKVYGGFAMLDFNGDLLCYDCVLLPEDKEEEEAPLDPYMKRFIESFEA